MASNQHSGTERTLMVGNRVLRGDDINQYCKKHGLCILCGQVQTHKRVGGILNGRMEPITTSDSKGNYTVYKGHCIQPTCYSSIEQVKERLGEPVVWKRQISSTMSPQSPRAKLPPIPSSVNNTPTTTSSPRVRTPYQPGSVFQPNTLVQESSTEYQYSSPRSAPNQRQDNNLNVNDHLIGSKNQGRHMLPPTNLPLETHPASATPQEYQHHQLLRPNRLSNSSKSYSSSDSSERIEVPTSVAAAADPSDIVCAPNFESTRTSSSQGSVSSSGLYPPTKLDSPMSDALDSERHVTTTNSDGRLPPMTPSRTMADSFNVLSSLMIHTNFNQQVSMDATSIPGVEELEALISEGDYISFINELDRRVGGNAPGQAEKVLFLEGLRLFRFYVVRDQLSRPGGVVLGSEGWVKEIVTKTTTTFNGDKDVAVGCLLTFLTFSTLPGNYKKFTIKKGGVDNALKILDEFKMDEQVSNLALALIVSLSLNEKEGLNAKYAKIATLVRRLVTVVSSGDCGKQFALRALFHLSCQRKRNQETQKSLSHDVKKALAAEGNIRALFDTMNEGVREATVETILSLLWRMSTSSATEDVDDDGPIPMTHDVIETLIGAMDSFDSISIREACCGILANLSMRKHFPSEMSQPVFISMSNFLHDTANVDEGLATCALHSICNMLENPASRTMLAADQRVIQTVISLLRRFSSSEELVEFGCLAIGHAARNDNSVKELIMQLGGFNLVKDAFETFVTSRRDDTTSLEVKDASLCAIASLSGCHSGARAVVNSGLLDVLETLLAVETDRDFATILEVIIRNTRRGASSGFSVGSKDILRQQPERFSILVETAESEQSLVTLLQGVMGSSQANIDVAVGREETYGSLLSAMARFADSASVQENGCALLAEIYFQLAFRLAESPNAGPWAPHHQRESLETIHSAMSTHRSHDCIQHYCCLVMLNLFIPIAEFDVSSPQRQAVCSLIERCFSDTLDCLRNHKSDRKVQKSGIAALSATISIARQQDLERWIMGIVQQIFASMQVFPDDPELLPIALDAILLLEDMNQGRESIRTSTNIKLLLDLSGYENAEVSGRSSAVLASLCQSDFTSSSHIMEYPGAIQQLLLGMRSNQEELQIQINIMSILETLVSFGDDIVFTDIQLNGGIFTLCNGLSLHTSSSKFVLLACRILSSVVPAVEVAAIMSERDLLNNSLTKAAIRHVEDAEVEAAIFDALWACCQQNDFFKQSLLDETQISTVVGAMQMNLGSADLQRSGCSLLWMLSTFGSGKEVIGSFGSIQTIINALLAHNESTSVQKEGLTALKSLATSPNNKLRIAEAGSENAVIWSMWIHYRDAQVLSIGLSALNNIAVDSQTRTVAQMNQQVLTIILAAMARFPADEQVQKNACFYLKSCSYLTANVQMMNEKSDQLIPLLLRAADTFPQECRDRATSIVNKLQHA